MYPTLYKKTATGATQVFKISVSGDTFTVEFGILDGKMQTKTTTCSPTNVGRANERSAEEQAIAEADSNYTKKIKKGYSLSLNKPSEIELPMKIKVYQDFAHVVPDDVLQSPKYNGVNGEFRLVDDKLVLLSRGGMEYPMLEHIKDDMISVMKRYNIDRVAGEIYKHGEHLQDITGAVKKFKELTKELEFYVFDLPTHGGKYKERVAAMQAMDFKSDFIKHIPSCSPRDISIDDYQTKCVKEGYEGTVIYDVNNVYQYNVRTSTIWKYKKALSAEYKIIGYSIDKNKQPVFECEVGDSTFKVKPKGTAEERNLIILNISDYIGKWYTIEYEMLSKSNKPLKPVGIALRECDENGKPLE
jgi:ATP-dependent DNA ligase